VKMPISNRLLILISLFFSVEVMAVQQCNVLIESHSGTKVYKINKGTVKTITVNNVTKIINLAPLDAMFKVRGLPPAASAWERLNPSESMLFLPWVKLTKVRCLTRKSATRSGAEIAAQQTANAATAITDGIADAANNVRDHFVGSATNCPGTLGNQDNQFSDESDHRLLTKGARGNKGKFKNFVVTSSYRDINHYLLMQASNKTYYHQVKYRKDRSGKRWDAAKNEHEFRCGVTELYKYWGLKKVVFANSFVSANAIIAADDKKVIVVVRGTQASPDLAEGEIAKSALDIAVNGAAALLPAERFNMGKGKVHGGYLAAAKTLEPLIKKALQKMGVSKNRPIFVTGHSLGGATATVLAQHMKVLGYNVKATYAYAPPKVGDRAFNNSLQKISNLFVTWNYRDPVPTLVRSDTPHPMAKQLKLTMEGAKKVIFYDKEHKAHSFENITSRSFHQRFKKIRELQGPPYPRVFLREGLLSNEWHFHDGNFYVAFAYKQLLDTGFKPKQGTKIEPSFTKGKMCLFWDRSYAKATWDWNANYQRFLNDKNGYPFQACAY